MKITKNDYQKTLAKVQHQIKKTQKNIVQTVNRQKVEMCWGIGKIIEEHLLKNNRPEYGKYFFTQLAKDTKIDRRTLYQMRSFFKAYPKLPKNEAGLNWSHYRNLSSIKDAAQRKQLEDLTKTQNLDSEELRQKISRSKPQTSTKLRVTRGTLFTYTKTENGEIDLGFNIFFSSKEKISVVKKSDYTYVAEIERIVDGDTLHVKLDLGFGIKHSEILRLAKINAAEAGTKEGTKATAGLKKILNEVKFLIVKTNKTDIYGRYVADVFFDKKEQNPTKVASSGTYLNQLLLDEKLAEVWQ